MYNKGFLYKIEDKKKDGNGHEIVTIELTPKDKKQNYFKIKLTIDKTNESILKTIVYDKNGTIHTYSINNQVPNINLKESFFTFNKTEYPGVEVIDLR
jgi:outer membrane lipoprotein-sorting protein